MRRIATDRATEDGLFQAGTPGILLPTAFSADWANNVQEALAQFIESVGLTLPTGADPNDFTLLTQAIALAVSGATGPHVTQLLEGKELHTTLYNATYYQKPAGQSLLRADWPEAWAAIQTSGQLAATHADWLADKTLWGPGVDADHFDMKDLRALFRRIDNDGKGGALGPALGGFKANQNASHAHDITTDQADGTGNGYIADSDGSDTNHTASSELSGGDEACPDHTSLRYVIRMK